MTEFILGPSGSGKSGAVTERILRDLAAGSRVILLVPEQMALRAEAELCEGAQRAGVPQAELEILNFRRLFNRVSREYGGIAYRSVTGGTKALILWKALFSSSPFLRRYQTELPDAKRFVPLLLSAFREFSSYGVTPAALSRAAEECREDSAALSEKLSDLSLIYTQYERLLTDGMTDPSDDLTRLAELLEKHPFFRGIHLYVDSFAGFTPQEFRVLSYAFRQAESVTVTVCCREEEENFAFENTKKTFLHLKRLAEAGKGPVTVTRLSKTHRFADPALVFLEENLGKAETDQPYAAPTSAVRTAVAPNPYGEAEFVAADITERLRAGASYRDFAVIVRDLSAYRGIIDAVFGRFGLPCHLSRKIELSEKPLFKLLLSAFQIKNGGWKTDDVIRFMKNAFSPVTVPECDELESYAYRWNIFGNSWYTENDWFMNPEGYTDILTDESAELLLRLNQSRKRLTTPLLKLFEALDGSRTVPVICAAVYDFLLDVGADGKVSESGSDDEVRLWNALCGALDTMAAVLPEMKADALLFAGLFSLVIEQTSVGTIPSAVDEIAVGSADLIRAGGVKHVYLLGVNEGVFPAACSDSGFFSDDDKVILETCGLILSPGSDVETVNEWYLFYSAACSASDSVTAVCSAFDSSGKALRPSVTFDRILALFPNAEKLRTDALPADRKIQNREASLEYAFLYPDTKEGKALRRVYSADPQFSPFFSSDRQSLVPEVENLTPETAKEVFGGNLSLTQSRLDSYVLCAFGYQCRYILKLKKSDRFEFRPSDTGTLIHRILEKFFSDVDFEKEEPLAGLSEEEIDRKIDYILEEYLSGIFGREKETLTGRAKQTFWRLRRSVRILVRNLLDELSQSSFLPRFFEMPLNDSGQDGTVAPLAVPLPDGTSAFLYGFADRVDICRKGEDVYVRVVDYKSGGKDFSLSDIGLGLNLQMLIYLFSIWKDRNGAFRRAVSAKGKILPAGVIYCTVLPSNVTVSPDTPPEEVMGSVSGTLGRKGLLLNDEEILRLMEKNLDGKYIPVSMKKNGLAPPASLETLEGMGRLMGQITDTVASLAEEIKKGSASPRPLKDKRHDACQYCPYAAVCRRPEGAGSEGGRQ